MEGGPDRHRLGLRADLVRLRPDRPEFASIRARASALIDRGDFDAARAVLQEGREAARALRKEFSRSEAEFLVDEARVNRLQLDCAAARANLAEATQLDPDNCWAWIELGDLCGFGRARRRRVPTQEPAK